MSRGHLELLDVQLPMLRKARRQVRGANLSNVGFACGSAASLPYRADAFDRVLMVAVLGEVSCLEDCVREIARVLQPGGLLVITELPGDPDAVPRDALEALVTPLGFLPIDYRSLRKGYSMTMQLSGE